MLADALERAAAGDGTMVLIEGTAGVGKSSLLDAARTAARERGIAVLAARGAGLEVTMPLSLAGQLLPLVDLTIADVESTSDRDRSAALLGRLQQGLLATLHGPSDVLRPHLLCIDDAQWGDAASLRYLAHLALRAPALPIALIVALRTGGTSIPPALEALRRTTGAEVLRLKPLTAPAVERIVRATLGRDVSAPLVASCATATGGNPFYLHELLRELVAVGPGVSTADVEAAAPESVLRLLLARLAAMGAAQARLTVALAILGDGTPLAWVAELAEIELAEAEAIADELSSAEILAPGEPLAVAHPLIASTLRGDMGAFARARAHRRAAGVLRRAGAAAASVASHLLHTRPDADAWVVDALREAASAARERGAPRVAAELLERALREPPDASQNPAVLLELANAEALIGAPTAVSRLEAALDVVTEPRERGDAIAQMARMLHQENDFGGATALVRRELAALPSSNPLHPPLRAALLESSLLDPASHAWAAEELAVLIAESVAGRPPAEPALLALVASRLAYGDGDRDLTTSLAIAAFARDPLVEPGSQGTSLGYAGAALVEVDALAAASPLFAAALAAAESRGAIIPGSIADHLSAHLNLQLGRLGPAVKHAESSLGVYRDATIDAAWAASTLARIQVECGDLDAAAAAIAVGEHAEPDGVELALLLEARADLAAARHEHAAALEDATRALAIVRDGFGFVPVRGFRSRRLVALAAHRLGRHGEAREVIDELIAQAAEVDAPRDRGLALACAGVIVDGEDGLALLEQADELLARSESTLAKLHGRLELGAAQRRAGDTSAAKATLPSVLELAERIGAMPLAARARRELWALGLRPRRAARTGLASLTPSEQRIAERAARGLSTPQIALELYVTRKTVESHLGHIYRKLAIRGRGELAAALDTPEHACQPQLQPVAR